MDLTDSKAIASLRWMLDMGADETISESPHNRFIRSHENLSSSAINSRDNRVTDKKKISNTNIKADPDTITHKEKIILANNLVKSLNSFEEILKGIESFKYFNERYENKKVELYEGNSRSPVVVFQEPLSYSEEIDDKVNCNSKKNLFLKIFRSIGLSPFNEAEQSICVISTLPLVFRDTTKSNRENFDLMWPFLIRFLTVIRPVAVIFIGNTVLENDNDLDTLKKEDSHLRDLQVFNFPSLDVLARAPKRKRLVWQQLLILKETLSKRKI